MTGSGSYAILEATAGIQVPSRLVLTESSYKKLVGGFSGPVCFCRQDQDHPMISFYYHSTDPVPK